MKSSEKKFDAVQLMREIRDRMSADMKDMSYEEKKAYIERHASPVREELQTGRTDKPVP